MRKSAPIRAKHRRTRRRPARGKNWIQDAIKKPGALRRTAKAAGAINKNGTINLLWLRQMARGNGLTAARARLALVLRNIHARHR